MKQCIASPQSADDFHPNRPDVGAPKFRRGVVGTAVALLSISLFALASTYTPSAYAYGSKSLHKWNAGWADVLNNKDESGIANYYNAESLVVSYPYKAESRTEGVAAITKTFTGGPFNLPKLKAQIDPLLVVGKRGMGLIIKRWDIRFAAGGFSGLAIEVAKRDRKKDPKQWYRAIDISGGGLGSPADFNQAQAGLDARVFAMSAQDIAAQLRRVKFHKLDGVALKMSEHTQIEHLFGIANDGVGLLVARVKTRGKSFITFNALRQRGDKWRIKIGASHSE